MEARAALAAGFTRWHAALSAGLRRVRDNGELAPHTDPTGPPRLCWRPTRGGVLLTAATGDHTLLAAGLTTVAGGVLVKS